MFDTEKLKEQPSTLETPETGDVERLLVGLSEAHLLELRARIDLRLPPVNLVDVNLEQETLRQFQQIRALFSTLATSGEVPANQKAQLANSCAAILKQLSDMQAQIYTTERFKRIEQALIRAIRPLPREAQDTFFEDYARITGEVLSS